MLSLRLVLHFYRNFYIPTLLISIIGCVLVKQSNSISYGLLFSIGKVFTNLMIGIVFHVFKHDQLYFYNNLGFSNLSIYTKVMLVDLLIWLNLLMLITLI